MSQAKKQMECLHIVIESTPGVFYYVPETKLGVQGRRQGEDDYEKEGKTMNTVEDTIKVAKMCQTNDCQTKREMQLKENGQSSCVEDKRKVFAKKEWKSLNIVEEKEKKILKHKIGFSGQRFSNSEYQDHSAKAEAMILRRDSMRHIGDWFYPEGGWGWKVMISSLIMNMLSMGLIMSQGQVMVHSINARVGGETNNLKTGEKSQIKHIPESVCQALLVSSCLSTSQLISPLIMSFCLHKSSRLAAFLGGLVMALGWLFTSFATQLHQIMISYSFLLGKVGLVSYHCTRNNITQV